MDKRAKLQHDPALAGVYVVVILFSYTQLETHTASVSLQDPKATRSRRSKLGPEATATCSAPKPKL